MSDSAPRDGDLAGSRFAVGCAQREVNDRDPALADVPRVPEDDTAEQRKEAGLAFEEDVFAELVKRHGLKNMRDSDDPVAATLRAMERGDAIIIGAALPVINHRGGRPDILVRHGDAPKENGKWAYLPVDAKNSKALEGTTKPVNWPVSGLDAPGLASAVPTDLGKGKPKDEHSLQLAHYWLMLTDLGHAPDDIAPIGATVNPDDVADAGAVLVWRPLSEAVTEATNEWNRRWSAINAVRDGEDRVTRPFLHGNCESCHWRDHCDGVLEEEQHVSLLRGVGAAAVATLADAGIHTIPELAECSPSGEGNPFKTTKTLAGAIDAARVAMSGRKLPFVPRGERPVGVPRADVEIDFDIENDDIVYLYGCHVSVRRPDGTWDEGEYRSFHTFDRSDPRNEAEVLAEFWKFLHLMLGAHESEGRTVKVYCYSGDFAEIRQMKLAAQRAADLHEREDLGLDGLPSVEDIESLSSQDWWVDIHKVVKQYLWPTRKYGLKDTAKLAGFSWDADDAGGANSIAWYRIASDPDHPDRDAMQAKLLRYNADDVLATKFLRQWLNDGVEGRGWAIPAVESLDT